jgi:hypothetical protein
MIAAPSASAYSRCLSEIVAAEGWLPSCTVVAEPFMAARALTHASIAVRVVCGTCSFLGACGDVIGSP